MQHLNLPQKGKHWILPYTSDPSFIAGATKINNRSEEYLAIEIINIHISTRPNPRARFVGVHIAWISFFEYFHTRHLYFIPRPSSVTEHQKFK